MKITTYMVIGNMVNQDHRRRIINFGYKYTLNIVPFITNIPCDCFFFFVAMLKRYLGMHYFMLHAENSMSKGTIYTLLDLLVGISDSYT